MKVNIKKLSENAVVPTYAKHGDAGMDLTATSKFYDDHGNVVYGTGLAFEIPNGYVGLLFPRSSNTKKDLVLGNSVGVLDSGYRGEVMFKFKPVNCYADYNKKSNDDFIKSSDYIALPQIEPTNLEIQHEQHQLGERVGQIVIMPIPQIEFNVVDDLSNSDRGVGGFGSTDPVTAAIESNC